MRFAMVCVLALLVISCVASGKEPKEFLTGPAPIITRANLDCTNAIPIVCGQAIPGTNAGAPNNVAAYNCSTWNESGGEVVYRFENPGPLCYVLSAAISGYTADVDVFILSACDEGQCIAYGSVTATTQCLTPGTYYIVIDGYNGAVSSYTLTLTCTECTCPVPPCCPTPSVVYNLDFNLDPNGFYTQACGGAAVWSWGPANYGPTMTCDDVPRTNVLGTVRTANYPANSGETAVIGPFAITPDCWCMELCHWYDTENRFDGGNVKVSTDGGTTWNLIVPARLYDNTAYTAPKCIPSQQVFTGHGNQGATAYLRDCFDLTPYVGSDVLIGFFFGSDSSVFYPGWYLKWVKIGGQASAIESRSWGSIKSMYR